MKTTEDMTRYVFSCDVPGCKYIFGTFKEEWAKTRGWTEVQIGFGFNEKHLHFCPRHSIKDYALGADLAYDDSIVEQLRSRND